MEMLLQMKKIFLAKILVLKVLIDIQLYNPALIIFMATRKKTGALPIIINSFSTVNLPANLRKAIPNKTTTVMSSLQKRFFNPISI